MDFTSKYWNKRMVTKNKRGREFRVNPSIGWIEVEDMYGDGNYRISFRGDYGGVELEEVVLEDIIALADVVNKIKDFYVDLFEVESIEVEE